MVHDGGGGAAEDQEDLPGVVEGEAADEEDPQEVAAPQEGGPHAPFHLKVDRSV